MNKTPGKEKRSHKKTDHWKQFPFLFLLLLSVLFSVLTPGAVQAASVDTKTIKVGFFKFAGYHDIDAYGNKSGYGYDFINMLARFDNDDYEFVGYDSGWNDMMNMLDNGEIDLLTNVAKTSEREKKYLYSKKTIGNDGSLFTVSDSNSTVVAGDYSTYDGLVIGSITDSVQITEFAKFAEEKGFTYTMKEYDTEKEMAQALRDGEIDGIVSIGLRNLQNEKVIEQIQKSDMYVIVRKEDTELMNQINRAIDRLDQESSNWRSELFDKYYQADQGDNISFLSDELDYIESLKEENHVLKVVVNPDRKPYSYYEDGTITGILPRIFDEVARRIGVDYEIQVTKTREEYQELLASGNIDLCLDEIYSVSEASDSGYKLTDPYLSTSLARITLKNFDQKVKTIAMLKHADLKQADADKLLKDVEPVYYDTTGECIAAVENKDADGAYVYAYAAQIALNQDPQNDLRMDILMDYGNEFAIGVPKTKDYHLVDILNKGVRSIEQEYIQNIITDETDYLVDEVPLSAYLSQNPWILVGIGSVIALLILAAVLLFAKNTLLREKAAQEAEFVQAMTYMCNTNELVRNTNLIDRTITDYFMENGKLEKKVSPYVGFDLGNHNEIFHPEDYPLVVGRFDEKKVVYLSQHGGGEEYFECRSKNAKGEYRWYGYTMQAVPVDVAHPCNYFVYKKDIHEAKLEELKARQNLEDALEMAQKASVAKGQFMSRMSHEIRTPLNAVIGYMSMGKDDLDHPEKMLHCIEKSEIAAKHLLNIINDVLDISSIESGKMKIAREDFDLKGLITEITAVFFQQAKNKGIRFEVGLQNLTQEWVIGDSLRVNQILMNLLGNAVKFTPEGGLIRLDIQQLHEKDHKIYFNFHISDSGIGMSEEYQKRLFQPFEQESATTAQKYGGSGLGLSITKNLVDMMGGNIKVHSVPGEGTTFTVALYFEKSDKKAEAEVEKGKGDFSKLRVLVVDDEKDHAAYIKNLLKRCKVKSDFVLSGKEAVQQLQRRAGTDFFYNMCIIDWNMPGLDGVETAREIRKLFGTEIPIIIATAYDTTEIEVQAQDAGVDRVIAKPLFQSTMFDLLVTQFGKYEVEDTGEKKAADLAGLHILLAEDNEMNMEIGTDVLTKAGIQVEPAVDGGEVCEKFLQSKPGTYDMILMDIQMPVMNGYEATQKIRKSTHGEAKTIPIVAMTANAFAEDIAEALANGMNDHISKPIDKEKLLKVIQKFSKRG